MLDTSFIIVLISCYLLIELNRDQGLALGHSDVNVRGPVGPHFQAQATAAIHTADRKLEGDLEELWLQTRSLPGGLQLRAGRFASQLGYLNELHPHSDDFVQRPLLYRALLGGHWFDDGVRVNWVAPTDLYLRLGLELFRGHQLVPEAAATRRPGAAVLIRGAWGSRGRCPGAGSSGRRCRWPRRWTAARRASPPPCGCAAARRCGC